MPVIHSCFVYIFLLILLLVMMGLAILQLVLDIDALALEGGLLGHARQNVDNQIGSGNRRRLSHRVVRRADLDDIGTDKVNALKSLEQTFELARGPAARFGSAGSRGNAGVENVNVDGQVCRRIANSVPNSLDDAVDANVVDLVGFDQSEADDLRVDNVVVGALLLLG